MLNHAPVEQAAVNPAQPQRPADQPPCREFLELEREIGALIRRLAEVCADLLLHQLAAEESRPAVSQDSPWLDFEGAQRYLGFSKDKLYKLTAAGAIPCRKKAGGQGLIFHRDELDAWMDKTYPRVDRLG